MRKYVSLYLFIQLFIISTSNAQVSPVSTPERVEVPVYMHSTMKTYVSLEMGYAKSTIKNPEAAEAWEGKDVYMVELVFTRYPHELEDWLTSYDRLLQDRLAALHRLDPELFSNPDIRWKYVMQTECPTEASAKYLFHGFVVHTERPDGRMVEIEEIAFQQRELSDSTAYQVLDRHSDWKDLLVIMDWTGSMYKYGASVLLWHRLNTEKGLVKHFVFFNDGDDTPNNKKVIGKTGGIYKISTNNIDSVLMKMNTVMDAGNGGDGEENDVEAVLKATKYLKDYEHVVLVADNRSDVRDLKLSKYMKRPVKIVLCGVDEYNPIHEDYLTMARVSGGSVHTIEKDIKNLRKVPEGKVITIEGTKYRLKNGRFERAGS